MSVEGDAESTELSDLVAQTLENSGVLSKIRAELRASVFLVLEEREALKEKNVSAIKKPLKDFLSTLEGKIIINLIQEFFEYFGLEFTAKVFEPEIQASSSCQYKGREKLALDLKLSSGKKLPLIAQVLQDSRVCFSTCSPKKSILINKQDKTGDEVRAEENPNQSSGIEYVINYPMKPSENSPPSSVSKPDPLANTPPLVKKPDRLDLNHTDLKPAGNSLSSLGGLPPIGFSQNNQLSKDKNAKPVTHDIRDLLDLQSNFPENNYEEDFLPSGSEKTNKDTNRSCSGSGSEIDEDMSVGMEDHTTDMSSGKSS